MTRLSLLCSIFLVIFSFSCKDVVPEPSQSVEKLGPIENLLAESSLLRDSFTGIMIRDADSGEILFEENANKYFTPASNTKVFSLYSSLHLLGDEIPTLDYIETDTSVIFWGTGDPTFLHRSFEGNKAFDFLKSQTKPLIFSPSNFHQNFYGSGWMWDDYNDYYQVESSPFPMYGNTVEVRQSAGEILTNPYIFQSTSFEATEGNYKIQRDLFDNTFTIPSDLGDYFQEIPLKTSPMLTQQLLMDTLKRDIQLSYISKPRITSTIYGQETLPVLKKMIKESDNFLAEQLLVLASYEIADSLNAALAINLLKENQLKGSPQDLKWVDGSGISRYNLFTPASMAYLLYTMRKEFGEEVIFPIMAQNGEEGTLRSFDNTNGVFIYGKSGSMTGVYNLCAYVKTTSGKTLAVSVMHNNFNGSVSQFRGWTESLYKIIRVNY